MNRSAKSNSEKPDGHSIPIETPGLQRVEDQPNSQDNIRKREEENHPPYVDVDKLIRKERRKKQKEWCKNRIGHA